MKEKYCHLCKEYGHSANDHKKGGSLSTQTLATGHIVKGNLLGFK